MRWSLIILLFASIFVPFPCDGLALAQGGPFDEMDLIERISELQDQLDAEQISDRDTAEQELIKLGPFALEHLDAPSDDMSIDKIERLARVRTKLETVAIRNASQTSMVSLDGDLTVEESLKRIREQTSNDVAISDNAPADSGLPDITWQGKEISFWDAITRIQNTAGLTIDPYAADGSRLRLVPADPAAANFTARNPNVATSVDMFHVQVARIDATRNLMYPNLDHVSVQLLIRWEPRLRPISLKLPGAAVTARDSKGRPIPVRNRQSVFATMIQPQIPEVELTIPLKTVPRDVEQIDSLKASINATLPGKKETFRFRRIGKLPPGKKIARAGATVTFEGIDKNEDLFGITLSLAFDEELNALESHQAWVFDNPIYLENQSGEKHTPLTYESIRQDNDLVVVTYYFAEDPGERTLVYQTPAAILQIQSDFELKGIPLP